MNLRWRRPISASTKPGTISLGGGEKRNVNVKLEVGSAGETVQVNAENMDLAVTDSGEKSFSLETEELENFTQVGSNAAEYIKIVPGFGIANGTQNKSNYNGQTIGINANGDSGSQSPLNAAYSYNGLPTNSLDITADGAHVSDPGCNCDTPVNPNSDFVQEFKVLDLELQRRATEGAHRDHIGDQGRRVGISRQRVFLRAQSQPECERLAEQFQRTSAARQRLLLSRRRHRRPGGDSRNRLQQAAQQAVLLHRI